MIGRTFRREQPQISEEAKGFDAFELRLGDVMRGERATLGKSLLDVQRELKIKAAYIAAIENCDPTAFDTPGFIAGYVRSYARYLGMDPDEAFESFCAESGFQPAHGMALSSVQRHSRSDLRLPDEGLGRDIFATSATPYLPAGESLFAGVEPRAVGSVMVLLALIGGLGWGGWSVLQEVQKVRFAPVDQTPTVVAEVDPLAGGARPEAGAVAVADATDMPSPEALDRLYRPQALDVPVLVRRDGPIAALSPQEVGTLLPRIDGATPRPGEGAVPGATIEVAGLQGPAGAAPLAEEGPAVPQVTAPVPELQLVAVRPAWVRVRSAEGTTLFEKIMDAGETWEIPVTEDPATLRVGESGALYFAVNGTHYGPAGPRGQITSDLALSADTLTAAYEVADLTQDSDLAEFVRYAEAQALTPAPVPAAPEGEALAE